MYHKLKQTLLSAHALTRRKLKGEYQRDSPLLTYEETGTSFQCAVLSDARDKRLLNMDFSGFRLRRGLAEMNTLEFLEYIKNL